MKRCSSILVVEDDQATSECLVLYLEIEGYSPVLAENGLIGLEKIRTMPGPVLILLDLMMPVMDGIEFLERIQDVPRAVILTSATADLVHQVCKKVDAIHPKPFDLKSLMYTIDEHCSHIKDV